MAIRVTKVSIASLSRNTSQAIRVTKVILATLIPVFSFEDNLNSWADFVETNLDTGITPSTVSVSSDLNNWNDLVETSVIITGINEEVSDDLNSWNDTSSVVLVALLIQEVSDDLNSWADDFATQVFDLIEATASSDLNVWIDGVQYQVLPNLEKAVEDSFTLTDDVSVTIPVNLTVTDVEDLNSWADNLAQIFRHLINATEDLNNWSDEVVLPLTIPLIFSDDLNSWADLASASRSFSLRLSDSFVLNDRLDILYPIGIVLSDTIVFVDGVSLLMGELIEVSESITLTDFLESSLATESSSGYSDNMNRWDDTVQIHLSDETDDYYRRYLNDREILLGERKFFFVESMTLSDEVSVGLS